MRGWSLPGRCVNKYPSPLCACMIRPVLLWTLASSVRLSRYPTLWDTPYLFSVRSDRERCAIHIHRVFQSCNHSTVPCTACTLCSNQPLDSCKLSGEEDRFSCRRLELRAAVSHLPIGTPVLLGG